MSAPSTMCSAVLLLLLAALQSGAADARDRRHHGHHNDWHDRWENRRDARRAGVVVGAIASGVARSAANERADRRYDECLQAAAYRGYDPATGYNAYGYGPDYQWCAQMRYEEEQRARRSGRRAGAIAGSVAYGIVRD